MSDPVYQTGKTAADNAYAANSAPKQGSADTVSKGTGQMLDLKPATKPQAQGPSLGEAAAKAKADKATSGKKAVKVMGEFSKGGKVKKTGVYKLHAKERVLNPKQTKKAEKSSALKSVLSGK